MLSFIAEAHLLPPLNGVVWMGFLNAGAGNFIPMPIQVRTKKLTPWKNDLADQIKVEMLNKVAGEFANEARSQLGKLKCERHPRTLSYITIAADRTNTMVIKRKFCCPEFKERISEKLKGYL
jgi:hypothetical protein